MKWTALLLASVLGMFSLEIYANHALDEGEPKGALRPTAIPETVVPTTYSYDPSLALLPEPVITDVQTRFSHALYLAKGLKPEGNNLWNWGKNKETLLKKSVETRVTTTADPLVRAVGNNFGADTDAMTIVVGSKSTGDTKIVVLLLVDKFAYDNKRERSRQEIAARMTTALAHELHGNVTNSLEMDPKNLPKADEQYRAKTEVRAFAAGIKFLEELMANPGFKEMAESEQAVYRERLANEKNGLKSWSDRLKKLEP